VWPPGSADTVCPRRPLMTQVQRWANTAQTDHVTLRPSRPLTLEVMVPVAAWCGSSSSIGARCVSALMGLMTLIFDLLTLKLVCESHQRWGTFPPNLDTLALWVLDFVAMYATDRVRRTDGQTVKRTEGRTKATLIAPFPTGGHKNSCRSRLGDGTVIKNRGYLSAAILWSTVWE